MIQSLKSYMRARWGGFSHRKHHAQMLRGMPSVTASLEGLESRWPHSAAVASDQRPIFLLASTWRAGSTALQRLVVSDPQVLVWGEPYRDCNYVQSMSESLRSLRESHPTDEELAIDTQDGDLSRRWIATMSPDVADLKRAHIEFMETMYAAPAAELGFPRWGLKEVRLDMGQARYLHWLFPRAPFVFLYRDPYAAYRSYRVFETWYARWPHGPMLSARDFGRHWLELTRQFVERHQEVGGVLLPFEELVQDRDAVAARLSHHLGLELDGRPLENVITGRGADQDNQRPPAVPKPELRELARVVGDLAERLGYTPPG